VRVRRRRVLLLLKVVRQDDAGDRPLGEGDAKSTVDEVPHLPRRHGRLDVGARDILEEAVEVDLLLIRAAHGQTRRLSNDGHDRLMIEFRVVESVEEVNGAGTGGGDADAGLARELGVCAGHEGGHLLVPDLDEGDGVLGTVQRAEEAVDAIAGIAIDTADTPRLEPLDDEVRGRLAHEMDRSTKPASACYAGAPCARSGSSRPMPRSSRSICPNHHPGRTR
jgi:hypothetical protein